jgi:hypothetical protein
MGKRREVGGQMTDDRGQEGKTEIGGQKTDDGGKRK